MNIMMNKKLDYLIEKYFAIVKSFIPQQEAKPLVGLDIGINSCKMVELKKKGSTYELVSWAITPIVSGDVKQAIKSVMAKLSIPNITPATAVSGKGCLIRFIDLPRMSPDDLKRSFAYESDKYFPFPRDQIYLDFFVADEVMKDNKMAVLVAAVKKEIVDDRVKLLTDMGLQVSVISLNSIAIANAIHVLGLPNGQPEDKGPSAIAILDLEEMVSSVTIMVNNLPRFNRDIFIGGRDFTRCICNTLQVSADEAQQLQDDPGDRREAVLQACDSAIQDLVSELRLSFDYFVTDKNIPLSRVLLTGPVSGLVGLADILAKNLEMSVTAWNPATTLVIGPNVVAQDVQKNAAKIGVALGLALYE
jgi:type IV pilus assembly protein PilM